MGIDFGTDRRPNKIKIIYMGSSKNGNNSYISVVTIYYFMHKMNPIVSTEHIYVADLKRTGCYLLILRLYNVIF